jgi:hypothetical protein
MKIVVDITGRDPAYPTVECPLRDSEFGVCMAHGFLHPPTRPNQPGLDCPVGVETDDGMYLYLIPDECPLRKGPLSVKGR